MRELPLRDPCRLSDLGNSGWLRCFGRHPAVAQLSSADKISLSSIRRIAVIVAIILLTIGLFGHCKPPQIATIGLDLANYWFQVHGVDALGQMIVRRKLQRNEVITYFKSLPPWLIGMEACATDAVTEMAFLMKQNH